MSNLLSIDWMRAREARPSRGYRVRHPCGRRRPRNWCRRYGAIARSTPPCTKWSDHLRTLLSVDLKSDMGLAGVQTALPSGPRAMTFSARLDPLGRANSSTLRLVQRMGMSLSVPFEGPSATALELSRLVALPTIAQFDRSRLAPAATNRPWSRNPRPSLVMAPLARSPAGRSAASGSAACASRLACPSCRACRGRPARFSAEPSARGRASERIRPGKHRCRSASKPMAPQAQGAFGAVEILQPEHSSRRPAILSAAPTWGSRRSIRRRRVWRGLAAPIPSGAAMIQRADQSADPVVTSSKRSWAGSTGMFSLPPDGAARRARHVRCACWPPVLVTNVPELRAGVSLRRPPRRGAMA